ncbi:MAG: hypothetical protein ACJ763_03115 [Bdellovibrionia bacterium]
MANQAERGDSRQDSKEIKTTGTSGNASKVEVPKEVKDQKFERGGTTAGGQGDKYAGASVSRKENDQKLPDSAGGTADRETASGSPFEKDPTVGGETQHLENHREKKAS